MKGELGVLELLKEFLNHVPTLLKCGPFALLIGLAILITTAIPWMLRSSRRGAAGKPAVEEF
jgi:hypothetical protein